MATLLIIDDEIERIATDLEMGLSGHRLVFAKSGGEALDLLKRDSVDLILLDLIMPPAFADSPDREGVEVLKEIRKNYVDIPVIVLTARNEIDVVIECIKAGAGYYLLKPPDFKQLQVQIELGMKDRQLRQELRCLREGIDLRDGMTKGREEKRTRLGSIIGSSQPMQRVYSFIEGAARSDMSVLITGESGTGKELVAREIHERGPRKNREFCVVNCSLYTKELLQSELFGHKRGAFTGAVSDRAGKFEAADGSTLFLDEIGEMGPDLQAGLLRVLQNGEIQRLGENRTRKVDVRVVCATNADLDAKMRHGTFRDDLYYRLAGLRVYLAPLRERKGDVPLLAHCFLGEANRKTGKNFTDFEQETISRMMGYSWPGNVREMENSIRAAVGFAGTDGGVLPESAFRQHVEGPSTPSATTGSFRAWQDYLWGQVLSGELLIPDLKDFRDQYGSLALQHILEETVRISPNLRAAAVRIGYVEDPGDEKKYNAFRQWLTKMGVKRTEME